VSGFMCQVSGLLEIIQEHVTRGNCDFGMRFPKGAQTRHVGTEHESDAPFRNICLAKICGSISTVEVPAVFSFDRDAAHAARMIWHGDKIYFRFETRQANGVEIEPFLTSIIIKNGFRVVGNVPLNVCGTQKASLVFKSFIFLSMHVDFCVWKIGQSTAVIEMHMGEDDVFDIFRLESKFLHLMKSCFVWIKRHFGDDSEELDKWSGFRVITQAKPCIHENGTLICFDQQTKCACFHPFGPTGVAGEAIEQVNGHIGI